jgi:hypothetical protein
MLVRSFHFALWNNFRYDPLEDNCDAVDAENPTERTPTRIEADHIAIMHHELSLADAVIAVEFERFGLTLVSIGT